MELNYNSVYACMSLYVYRVEKKKAWILWSQAKWFVSDLGAVNNEFAI